ncbi:MAG: redoxin domain-containing protein [Saprospiraceae bacterium]|nr:redoxin domain-containing protein [Saprospiraceae bacterium]
MQKEKVIAKDSIYQFIVHDLHGRPIDLSQYEGKILLIVNIASKCIYTPQLKKLEELYQKFHDQGFEILAFPSNDFLRQEPLHGEKIEYFCVNNYNTSFSIFEKAHVKGSKASALFRFLSNRKINGRVNTPPLWNFHKYLIDREGKVVTHFFSFISPTSFLIQRAIRKLL